MKIKTALTGVAMSSLVVLMAACGSNNSSSSAKKTTITYMQGDVLQTMDPAHASDIISGQSIDDTESGLYRYKNKKIVPDLATKNATVTNNGKTYTFHLRKNAKWSDGKALTANDFVYSWQRIVNPQTKSEYAYIFSGIKNADAIMAGKKNYRTLGVKAIGKYTFQVQLEKAMPYFNSMITLQTFDPVEKSAVEKYGAKFGTNAKYVTYSGEYRLKKWSGSETTWTENKNKSYWNAKNVNVDQIKYQVVKDNSTALNLFEDGKIDDVSVSGDSATQKQNDPAYNTVLQNGTYYLELNQDKVPALKNQKVRQALSLAINRKQFIKQVLGDGSKPIKTVVPANMMSNSQGTDFTTAADKGLNAYASYNLAKAKQLFKEGMKEAGQSSLKMTLLTDDTDTAKATVEYLQNAFQKLGSNVTVSTKEVPFKTRLQLSADKNFDVVVSAWSADFPDAISFLDLFTTGNTYNRAQWSNSEYDRLIQASKTTDSNNPSKRWNDMVKAAQLLTKQDAVIPVYQSGKAHLTNTKVKGLHTSPNGMIYWDTVTKK
ncbi:peptide ABC transporter substrate-binding protein [Lacticaseibacillus zhaodongensis]|uniref:peptide ABC transporter substrate-binding protein n=1 Tax=Lacticaseibacillus zhaodongensis TaxID=2668065 RepID=UPI0012D2DA8C|nr:peptide ABC transporter substrate-binding protein [Lacticaseibacillus zhaodongensis]